MDSVAPITGYSTFYSLWIVDSVTSTTKRDKSVTRRQHNWLVGSCKAVHVLRKQKSLYIYRLIIEEESGLVILFFFHGRNKLLQNVNNNRTCRHEPVTQRLSEHGQMFRALQKTMHRKIFRATTREFNNRTEMFDIKSTSMSVRSLSLPHTARPPRLRISRPTSR